MVPTGEQLIEKNRLTSTTTITAAVHFSYNVGNGWTSRRVWFSPPGYWRVEDADGVELVVGPDYTYVELTAGSKGTRPGRRPGFGAGPSG